MCLSMPTADASTPAPDVAHVGQLEQALQRAVLAERAVQQREDDVDLAEHARQLPGLEHLDVAVVDRLREQHVRGGVLHLRQVPVGRSPSARGRRRRAPSGRRA